jgi:hypothetical protein
MQTASTVAVSGFRIAFFAGVLLLASSGTGAQDARVAFKPGVVGQAEFVAPDIGPAQRADFQVNAVDDHRLRGYLIGSEGLCHGRFQVEGRWSGDELVINSPSRFGTINARLRSVSGVNCAVGVRSFIITFPCYASPHHGQTTET